MKYEKNAKTTGVNNVVLAVVLFTVLIVLHYFFFSRPDASVLVTVLAWLIGGLVGGVFLWQGLVLITTGGQWIISIDQERISWSSPNERIDQSFDVLLSEVESLETRQRVRKNGKISSRSHHLLLKNGTEIKLSPNSGINLTQVMLELERTGLPHEHVRRT